MNKKRRIKKAETYKEALATYLEVSAEQVTLYYKGRVALYAILKAMGVGKGDEVILPAFTCVVVPNAIIYLGAKPVYVDIDPQTYNINPDLVRKAVGPKTKVVMAQNTFGLSPDVDEIVGIADEFGCKIVDDCTHGFGGNYNGAINGTIVDASFFSTQWNKPFSTGIGGIAIAKDLKIAEALRVHESTLLKPSAKDETMLRSLMLAKDRLLTPNTYWAAVSAYRWLSEKKWVVGSSDGEELTTPTMPADFLKGMGKVQATRGIHELGTLNNRNDHRIKIAARYDEILENLGVSRVFQPEYAKHIFLKYPLLVSDRIKFLDLAKKARIELGEWFLSPIHPIQKNFENWQYSPGSNPIAERIASQMVNLPTNLDVDEKYLHRIQEFLRTNSDLLIR